VAVICGQNDCNIVQRIKDIKSLHTPIRGVNLGSWFNLEGWMVPNMWAQYGCDQNAVQGQWQFERCVGSPQISSALEQHWSSFIRESDFARMAQLGVNAIRLPIGWWMIYDPWGGADKAPLNYYITPKNYTVGGLKYMDAMFDWAEKYSIGILIDMHSAPGSQNGEQDSSPAVSGQEYWDQYPANQGETVDAIGLYAARYSNRSALLGFCLLNEPIVNVGILQDYYQRAYTRIRQYATNNPIIMLNPLISPFQSGTESEWTGFMNPANGYVNVWMDLHYYECFGGPWNASNPESVIDYAKYNRAQQINYYNQVNPKPMIVGEWSDCGVPVSSNYPYQFMQAQVDSYGLATAGWTFWAWPNPSQGNVWSLQTAFNSGWISVNQMSQVCNN